MPPPSQLAIATSSLNRLVKEESSYRTELASQQKRVEKLQAGGGDDEDVGNLEFQLRQEKQGIAETEAIFAPLRERTVTAVEKLEGMLQMGSSSDAKEVEAAKDAVERSKGVGGDTGSKLL